MNVQQFYEFRLLQLTNRYICNSTGFVICQSGWKEPEDHEERDELNPCPEPICGTDTETCENGVCTAPDHCACEIGWEGALCNVCVRLPGCLNGNCTEALECNCHEGWTGGYCNMRKTLIISIFHDVVIIKIEF